MIEAPDSPAANPDEQTAHNLLHSWSVIAGLDQKYAAKFFVWLEQRDQVMRDEEPPPPMDGG